MRRFFVITPEFNRVGSYHPPEYGRDVVEVEAQTVRKALVVGLRELKRIGSRPIEDAISDGRTPFGILTVEPVLERVTYLTREQRFWAHVEAREDGCWIWTGGKGRHDYGLFTQGGGLPSISAHRFAYEDHLGPIDGGLELDHLCRTHPCVRPTHLEPVTHLENACRARKSLHPYTRRMNGTGSVQAAKTHCPQGHIYDAENTYYTPSKNQRACRTCRRARTKADYYRQKASASV